MKLHLSFIFLLLNNFHNDAFYKSTIPSFFHNRKNNYCLYNFNDDNNNEELDNNNLENNDLEIEIKSFNKNIRLGRSKDQDGKSNIWSVEPKMEVVEEEITGLNKNILTAGLILTGFLASLPILYTLNHYIMDMDY
jgi:peptidoglycan hydrolase CwlO-like protein